MENVIKMIWNAQEDQTEINKSKELVEEIKDVRKQMACIDMWFQMENDYDLIEACIYQREMLKAKYRYLMRKAKKENVSSLPFQEAFQYERG